MTDVFSSTLFALYIKSAYVNWYGITPVVDKRIYMKTLKGFKINRVKTVEFKRSESWVLESTSFSAHTLLCNRLMRAANRTLFEWNQNCPNDFDFLVHSNIHLVKNITCTIITHSCYKLLLNINCTWGQNVEEKAPYINEIGL